MRKFISLRKEIFRCAEEEKIFVKAKTAEGLESVGEGKAIEAWVNCLLSK